MGTLYWITGLSGAGKTTVAQELLKILKKEKPHTIFLDGDELRSVFNVNGAYSPEERLKLAMQYARLCKVLVDQGVDVVCATISMFHECREWNRKNISRYREIYLRVPMDILKKRDSKSIYSRAARGEVTQVMGIDLPFDEPRDPDLIVDNDGTQPPKILANQIYQHFVK